MTAKSGSKQPKSGHPSPRSPKRLGPMTTARKIETEPSYVRVLQRFGLIGKNEDRQVAWAVWQRVCADHEVIARAMQKAARKSPLPSVTEPFKNGAQVLAAMTEKELASLRKRIGA
jgi:hypothetical protein